MASLTLQHDDRVLKQYAVGPSVTIGRLPDNTVVIDNAAVSSHHACVFREGDKFIVEDLQSTNGTFVNNKRVTRETLRGGDVVRVGKHTLVFDQQAAGESTGHDAERPISSQGDTVYLKGPENQRLLAVVLNAEARAHTAPPATAPQGKLGVLRLVSGRADQTEYALTDHTSLIGRSTKTMIRLKGWFAPRVAVAITRNQLGYVATRLGGKMLVNSRPMTGRHDLKDGDVLEVGGLTLMFSLKH